MAFSQDCSKQKATTTARHQLQLDRSQDKADLGKFGSGLGVGPTDWMLARHGRARYVGVGRLFDIIEYQNITPLAEQTCNDYECSLDLPYYDDCRCSGIDSDLGTIILCHDHGAVVECHFPRISPSHMLGSFSRKQLSNLWRIYGD